MSVDIFDYSWVPSSGLLFQLYSEIPSNELIGAEIGVRTGSNTIHILRNCPKIKHFFAIDPFIPYQDGTLTVTQEDQDLVKQILLHRVSRNGFSDKVTFIFKTSDDAVELIDNNVLDFIYIDGDHSEEFFKRDLYNYISKVKVGGIVSGHDASWEDVKKVLLDFYEKTKIEVYWDKTTDSWYFQKTEEAESFGIES